MISRQKLQLLRETPIDLVNIEDIPDIRDINIDTTLSKLSLIHI